MKIRPLSLARCCARLGLAILLGLFSVELLRAHPEHHQKPKSESWYLGGYLAEKPDEKVWVRIHKGQIASFRRSSKPPKGSLVIESESYIFPGFIDMHNHPLYNILPLWSGAKGQFDNRFEWRAFPPNPWQMEAPDYRSAVSSRMGPWARSKGGDVCALTRYAEIKAIIGGAVAIQGAGAREFPCVSNYLLHNIEIEESFGEDSSRSKSLQNFIVPEQMESVFLPFIKPMMDQGKTFDEANEEYFQKSGVRDWVNRFTEEGAPTMEKGLQLCLGGDDFKLFVGRLPESKSSLEDLEKETLYDLLNTFLIEKDYYVRYLDPHRQAAEIFKFLWGRESSKTDGYLERVERSERDALYALRSRGVLPKALSTEAREWAGSFTGIRNSVVSHLNSSDRATMTVHVSEGRRDNQFNRQEYSWARQLGLTTNQGLIAVHGVGLSPGFDPNPNGFFEEAKRDGTHFVWSPFSNLLLYGDTLDVPAAMAAGIPISLGPDWSPTGSKNILGELKIAHAYALKNSWKISDREFSEMLSLNAAKALKLDDRMGQVERGHLAHLSLIRKRSDQPYRDLMTVDEADVSLVVIEGKVVYGDEQLVLQYENWDGAAGSVGESFRPKGSACQNFPQKRLRVELNDELKRTELLKYSDLKAHIVEALQAYKNENEGWSVLLDEPDAIFSCEDLAYQSRVKDFVSKEVDQNLESRSQLRKLSGF